MFFPLHWPCFLTQLTWTWVKRVSSLYCPWINAASRQAEHGILTCLWDRAPAWSFVCNKGRVTPAQPQVTLHVTCEKTASTVTPNPNRVREHMVAVAGSAMGSVTRVMILHLTHLSRTPERLPQAKPLVMLSHSCFKLTVSCIFCMPAQTLLCVIWKVFELHLSSWLFRCILTPFLSSWVPWFSPVKAHTNTLQLISFSNTFPCLLLWKFSLAMVSKFLFKTVCKCLDNFIPLKMYSWNFPTLFIFYFLNLYRQRKVYASKSSTWISMWVPTSFDSIYTEFQGAQPKPQFRLRNIWNLQ